jgi:glycine/D-amino acid oxidase-like deaminating enzyme
MENPPHLSGQYFIYTSGAQVPVWEHTEPFSQRPKFPQLDQDLETDVVVVGAGITGISVAYELVTRGLNIFLLEAREVLSGETGRTSGHLANALDDGYVNIADNHGNKGAIMAAGSHAWAIERVGEIARTLGMNCEYRKLYGVQISQYDRAKQPKEHAEEVKQSKGEVAMCKSIGMDVQWVDGYAVKGWSGKPDQRDGALFSGQAAIHPVSILPVRHFPVQQDTPHKALRPSLDLFTAIALLLPLCNLSTSIPLPQLTR